jgi:hypothetical protein
MSTNLRCKLRPKWPQYKLQAIQRAERTAYLMLLHHFQPHTEPVGSRIPSRLITWALFFHFYYKVR